MLDQMLSNLKATNVATTNLQSFNGDWTQQNVFIPIQAQLWDSNGEEILYPRMGMLNKTTINGSVKGFKRSSNQLIGLIKSDPTKMDRYNQDLQKLAVIAARFRRSVPEHVSKFDGSRLYYQDGIMTIDNADYQVTMCVIISDDGNTAFKIEERKAYTGQSMPDAPEMDNAAAELLTSMLNAYKS